MSKNNVRNNAKKAHRSPKNNKRRNRGAHADGASPAAAARARLAERYRRNIHISADSIENETVLLSYHKMNGPSDAVFVQAETLAINERFQHHDSLGLREGIQDTGEPLSLARFDISPEHSYPHSLYRGIVTDVRYESPYNNDNAVCAICITGPRIYDSGYKDGPMPDDPFYYMVGTHLWLYVNQLVPGGTPLKVHLGDTVIFAGEATEYESEGTDGKKVQRKGIRRWTPVASELVFMAFDRVCGAGHPEWETALLLDLNPMLPNGFRRSLKGDVERDRAALRAHPAYKSDYRETFNPKFDRLRS